MKCEAGNSCYPHWPSLHHVSNPSVSQCSECGQATVHGREGGPEDVVILPGVESGYEINKNKTFVKIKG